MKKTIKLVAIISLILISAVFLFACGDNTGDNNDPNKNQTQLPTLTEIVDEVLGMYLLENETTKKWEYTGSFNYATMQHDNDVSIMSNINEDSMDMLAYTYILVTFKDKIKDYKIKSFSIEIVSDKDYTGMLALAFRY